MKNNLIKVKMCTPGIEPGPTLCRRDILTIRTKSTSMKLDTFDSKIIGEKAV